MLWDKDKSPQKTKWHQCTNGQFWRTKWQSGCTNGQNSLLFFCQKGAKMGLFMTPLLIFLKPEFGGAKRSVTRLFLAKWSAEGDFGVHKAQNYRLDGKIGPL
jgi:hypothetical protein